MATLEDVSIPEVPDELRVIAFSKVFDLRAGNAVPGASAAREQAGRIRANAAENGGGNGDVLASIADRLGLDRSTVAEVYDVEDDKPTLIVQAGKLPGNVSGATKEIALLIAGARQAAGIEDWTSVDIVRDVCSDYKRYDQGNFAKTMRQMESVFKIKKDSSGKLTVALAKPGWEDFGGLVRRFGGES
jgi:hypothetical protein